jgi:hypothetical protein
MLGIDQNTIVIEQQVTIFLHTQRFSSEEKSLSYLVGSEVILRGQRYATRYRSI